VTVRATARRVRRAGQLALWIAALVSATVAAAQVTARQGEAAKEVVTEFESPMVLDVPLKGYDSVPSGASKMLGGFRNFVCEDTSLVGLKVVKRVRKSRVTLEIAGMVGVRESMDRIVSLRFDLARGERILASAVSKPLDAEEEKVTPFAAKLSVSEQDFVDAFEGEDVPLLRITMSVRDNS
jgi:hypothetical protein